jgi:hypothetical protein
MSFTVQRTEFVPLIGWRLSVFGMSNSRKTAECNNGLETFVPGRCR